MEDRIGRTPERDHIFISYAIEDVQFARWLALRLTAEGYKVWFDQLKLLGGESWPKDIDIAIKTRAFRVLGLLSKHSIAKSNPLKERALALNIAQQPGRKGFLIPINVDGLSATDIDWLTADLTYIQFASSWSVGLSQLLKLLDRERCPKSDGDARAIVSRIASSSDLAIDAPEQLISNACPFVDVPSQVLAFRVSPTLENRDLFDAQRDWACYPVSPHRVLAFHSPGVGLQSWLKTELAQSYEWRHLSEIEGISSQNVVVRLLRNCVENHLRAIGFQWSAAAEAFAVPGPLSQSVRVVMPGGSATTVQHSGERSYFRVGQPKSRYRYRIAVRFTVEPNLFAEFNLVWRLRFHLTGANDEPLPETQRHSRRKHLTRGWFNRHWLIRHLATMQRSSHPDGKIRIGPSGDGQVTLDCRPAMFLVSRSIDETKLAANEEIDDETPVDDSYLNDDAGNESEDQDVGDE